jgi:folate-dependent phosphoribosylglycinamide formyltransferase PurN
MLKLGWFSTGKGEGSRQLLQAVQQSISNGDIDGKIIYVFCNREPGESEQTDMFFKLVQSYGIPLVYFSSKKFRERLPANTNSMQNPSVSPASHYNSSIDTSGEENPSHERWRILYDREIDKRIKKFAPDICVMAGYMLILGDELCQRYTMINIHPAAPGGPVGTWKEVMWKLIEQKAEQAGAMMHLVTPELDKGPVISYCSFPIKGLPFEPYWQKDDRDSLFTLIRQYELAREFPLIISTIKALSHGEICIKDNMVIDAHGKILKGYDLSREIDKLVTETD